MTEIIDGISTGQVLGSGGAIAAIAGAAYSFLRIVKANRRDDAKADKMDEWSESLLTRVRELELRVDKMAQERNEALQAAAKMTVEIEYLKEKVKDLESVNDLLKEAERLATLKLNMKTGGQDDG